MLLTPNNTRAFVQALLPEGFHPERSTIFQGNQPIADIVVNEAGVYINSIHFPYGDIPEKRIEGLRRWLSR